MQEATSLFRSILNRLSLDFGPDEFELENADIERDLQYGCGELQVELAESSGEGGNDYLVVLYEPGSSWRTGRSLHEQPLDRQEDRNGPTAADPAQQRT